MTNFLPNISGLLTPGKLTLFVLALAGSIEAQAQADLQLSNFVLTPGDERGFDFTYSVTNAGNQAVASYAMQLTFSKDESLDAQDYFTVQLDADAATQSVAAGESAVKTLHFATTAVNEFLPTGTWYAIAEINFDGVVVETDVSNNILASDNTITVLAYTAQFLDAPTVGGVTNEQFVLQYTADGHIYHCYYRYQFEGAPAPTKDDLKSSSELFPDEPVTIHYVSPAQVYDVYFMGEARDGNVTDIHKVQVTTTGSNTPSVVSTHDLITIFPAGVGSESTINMVGVYAHHLTGPVVVTASLGFVASLDDVIYDSELSIPAEGFDGGTRQYIFIKAQPFDNPGYKVGTCTLSTIGASNEVINLGVVIFSNYATDFDGVNALEETGWSSYSVTGDQAWSLATVDETVGMQIDGASGGAAVNEDWLISPEVNLMEFTQTPAVRFAAYSASDGEPLSLKYSADYPGYGDPNNATWFDANASFPSVNSKLWKNVMVKILDQGEHVRFAFVYKSTSTKGSRWAIDDWRITDNPIDIPDHELVFDDVSVGKASDPKSMLVSVSGFGSVTITASDQFQVSSDGVVFSPAIVIPESDIATGVTLRVRYLPKEFIEEKHGSLTFTAGGGLSVVRDILIGHPGLTTAVEDRLILTAFLYPNPTSGEVHVDLSALPNTEALYPVMVANSIGVSVAALNVPGYTLENTLSNIFLHLQPGVYIVIIKGASTTWRTKLIRN